jgi:hypothetical protein
MNVQAKPSVGVPQLSSASRFPSPCCDLNSAVEHDHFAVANLAEGIAARTSSTVRRRVRLA